VDYRAIDLSLLEYNASTEWLRRAGTSRLHDPRERPFRLPRILTDLVTRWFAAIRHGLGVPRDAGYGAIESGIRVRLRTWNDDQPGTAGRPVGVGSIGTRIR
jgi:hypothetical protein